ncbi:hypothetical protein GGX14DRAFT_570586 [Mycena pura]|uniref:Uncharacterized protein n=1 Tax=Mycena pura TaxID=153505 RepID=A0AAD6V8R2_9AGAR|nr:hypothetical protein GGX14DRAFT_570586 [Mycena pura]
MDVDEEQGHPIEDEEMQVAIAMDLDLNTPPPTMPPSAPSPPSRLSSTLEVSRSPKAYPDSYQQVAPFTVELHPRGVALPESLPTPVERHLELSRSPNAYLRLTFIRS